MGKSKYQTEANIQNEIRLGLSPYGMVFRTNAGEFWQGKSVYSTEFGQRALINLRKVAGLPAGFSDLIFIDGDGIAFIETKTQTGEIRPEQKEFIKLMAEKGHRSGIARCMEDAMAIINGGRNYGND